MTIPENAYPIGTRLRRNRSNLLEGKYECEVVAHIRQGYRLYWKNNDTKNTWSYDGVHDKMTVVEYGSILPEELFHV